MFGSKQNQQLMHHALCDPFSGLLDLLDWLEPVVHEVRLKPVVLQGRWWQDHYRENYLTCVAAKRREEVEHNTLTLMIIQANDSPMCSDASATFKLQQLTEPQQQAT